MGTLTNAIVRELKPRQGTYEVTCAGLPGFAVRVLPTGKKVFVVRQRVDGKDTRQKIGPWSPTLPVEDARRKAALILSGVDPALLEQPKAGPPAALIREPKTAPRRARPEPAPPVSEHLQRTASPLTVQQLAERFLAEYVDVYLKPNTAKNFGALVPQSLPLALDVRPMRVALEDEIPQELMVLAVKALADDERLRPQLDLTELGLAEADAPCLKPLRGDLRAIEAVVQGREQVRFSLTTLADQDDRLAMSRADRLHRGDHVGRWVRDAEEIGRVDLRSAGVVLVRQLDGRPLEAAALEFFA